MIYVNAKTNDGIGFIFQAEAEALTIQGFRIAFREDEPCLDGEKIAAPLAGMKIAMVGPIRTFTLDELKATNQWFDHSNWMFGVSPETLDVTSGRNLYADTAITHEVTKQYCLSKNQRPAFFLTVPHASADFMACGITIVCDQRLPVVCQNEIVPFDPDLHMHQTFPVLKITGAGDVTHDGVAVLTISAFTTMGDSYPHPLDVYLEATAGYLPKQRIEVNGSATFKVYALGLDAGDSIKLKAGFRYYSGKAEAIIKVT